MCSSVEWRGAITETRARTRGGRHRPRRGAVPRREEQCPRKMLPFHHLSGTVISNHKYLLSRVWLFFVSWVSALGLGNQQKVSLCKHTAPYCVHVMKTYPLVTVTQDWSGYIETSPSSQFINLKVKFSWLLWHILSHLLTVTLMTDSQGFHLKRIHL